MYRNHSWLSDISFQVINFPIVVAIKSVVVDALRRNLDEAKIFRLKTYKLLKRIMFSKEECISLAWLKEKEEFKTEICEILTRIGALKFGTFTLVGGKLSPYYIDLRIVPSIPEAFNRIGKIYVEIAKNDVGLENFTRIAGIPTAGVPFASVLAFSLSKPFLYVRKEIKTHGRERRIEGILHPGDRVLLVDDLITTGGSLLAAADAIQSEGGVVKDALVLIDREEGGKDALAKMGIQLHYLARMTEVAKFLYEIGTISREQWKDILKQIKK